MQKPAIEQASASNSENLLQAFDYLRTIIRARSIIAISSDEKGMDVPNLAYVDDGSIFALFIKRYQPSFYEYLFVVSALATEFAPALFEEELVSLRQHPEQMKRFAEAHQHSSPFFVPSVESVLYLGAGDIMQNRLNAMNCLNIEHWLFQDKILCENMLISNKQSIEQASSNALSEYDSRPLVQQCVRLHPGFRQEMLQSKTERFVNAKHAEESSTKMKKDEAKSKQALTVPTIKAATVLSTSKKWSNLVLADNTQARMQDLIKAIKYTQKLQDEWHMEGKIMPGYRALFHGPSGTGKTLSASLLGKMTKRTVQRVDLSQIVSKYIGETEKNLARLFDQADHKDWILFFDEADALFGKRTSVKDSHDRYANQEVSYLLQRVEEFAGITILATNFKGNMDEAFIRRFNTIIPFELPSAELREKIWRANLPTAKCQKDLLDKLSVLANYALTGGSIVNAIQHACLQAIARGNKVNFADCTNGIALEMEKQGKVFQT